MKDPVDPKLWWKELKAIKATTTWLKEVGAHYGKPAGELEVGDVMVWNYGGTSTVSAITKETEKTITVLEHYESRSDYADGNWKPVERRLIKNRIVAIDGMGIANVTKGELDIVRKWR